MPEIMVTATRGGKWSLNMDLPRSRDDVRPYVIFDRSSIERSGSLNVGDFLKEKLTMSATSASNAQDYAVFFGSTSSVNLRGLGSGQTLILIDGRRMATATNAGTPMQQDLNGISLSAIERIEVLPSSASGIYGGGATGGVVNVIMRRDYTGVEVNLNYQNTFDSDSASRRADVSAGHSFNDGKTNILVTASYSDANSLSNQDRDFVQRGRAAILANNPAYLNSSAFILPTGSTPNIRSADGSNLVLKDSTPLNSSFTFIPVGYAGIGTDNGAALVANAGRYNLELANSRQAGGLAGNAGKFHALLHVPTVKSGSVSLRHQFSPRLQGFLEASAADNSSRTPLTISLATPINLPASAPNNPFTTDILVQVPDDSNKEDLFISQRSMRAAAGLIVKLTQEWMGEIDVTLSRSRQDFFSPGNVGASGIAALASGSPDIMRDTGTFPLNLTAPFVDPFFQYAAVPPRTRSLDAALRLSGTVATLPAGKVILSSLIQYRDDTIEESMLALSSGSVLNVLVPSKSQSGQAAYAEIYLPLVSDQFGIPGVHELTAELAARYDRYTTHGATSNLVVGSTAPVVRRTNKAASFNPSVGLRYRPIEDVALRVSYSTGFLPPSVLQLVANSPGATISNRGTDPRRGNESVLATTQTGGNANLEPEESTSLSAGIIFTPSWLPGLRISVDYTQIEKTDNIITPTAQQLIDNEATFSSRITRGDNRDGDLPGWPGPITFIDTTLVNAATAELEALDVQMDYEKSFGRFGTVQGSLGATRTMSYTTQILPTTTVVENVGYGAAVLASSSTSPAQLRLNGGLVWHKSAWSLGWSFNYVSDYLNYAPTDSPVTRTTKILNQGNGTGRIPSQIYHDVFAKYRFDRPSYVPLLEGLEIQGGIKNVFNTEPPLDFGNTAYFYSYYGDPRLATYYLSIRKSW